MTATITTPAQMTAWADARRGVYNLYLHVNDLSPNTRKKGEKGDVTRLFTRGSLIGGTK